MPETDTKPSVALAKPELSRRELVEQITDFDGDNIPIHFFIQSVEFAFENCQLNEKSYFERVVLSKLKGRASKLVHNRRVTDWEEIKILLQRNFGQEKSAESLIGDLFRIKSNKNDSVKQVYNRVSVIRDNLVEAATETCEKGEAADAVSNFVEKCAKSIFLMNIPHDIEVAVLTMNPKTLENAFKYAMEIEKQFRDREDRSKFSEFKTLQKQTDGNKKRNNYSPKPFNPDFKREIKREYRPVENESNHQNNSFNKYRDHNNHRSNNPKVRFLEEKIESDCEDALDTDVNHLNSEQSDEEEVSSFN